jgi:uncharacterized protein
MNTRLTSYFNALLILATTTLAVNAEKREPPAPATIIFTEQQLEISVEIASSMEQRELGLMHRTTLGLNHGMLFTYPDRAPRSVWMKNTRLPLDVLFLSSDGHIVAMLDNLQPCTRDPCPIYNSQAAAMYMLELNAGFIKKHNLKIDQTLRLP